MKTIRFPGEGIDGDFCSCVALGNFDGVHRGHRKVISRCIELSKEQGMFSAVYIFETHPKAFFGHDVGIITINPAKEKIIERHLSPDYLVFQEVNSEFFNMSPEMFVESVLIEKLHAKNIVIGRHYTFGKDGMGNAALLKSLCACRGINVEIMPLVCEDGVLLSSTAVRALLLKGEVDKANKVLGYDFFIEGEIVHGNHIGAKMGFPTINVEPVKNQILPQFGVYATVTELDGKTYPGVTNIGVKPTIGSAVPVMETNLFGIDGDLYGKKATVAFKKQLRREKQFLNLDELKRQIAQDSELAKKFLG